MDKILIIAICGYMFYDSIWYERVAMMIISILFIFEYFQSKVA